MEIESKKPQIWAWAAGLVIAISCFYFWLWTPPLHLGKNDPDHYFHLAIAKLTAQTGIVRSLPQPENLLWSSYFPDKEFLFHAIGGITYRIAGEQGVEYLVPILGILLLLSLWFGVHKLLGPGASTAVVLSTFLLNADFFNRSFMLRPHLLAVFIFVWIVWAAENQRKILLGLFCGIYALSYHAFYLPLLVLAVQVIPLPSANSLWPEKYQWRLAGAGILGLILGSVINPYFPSNIEMGLLTLREGLGAYPDYLRKYLGDELVAPSSSKFVLNHFFMFGLVFAGSVSFLRIKAPARLWRIWILTAGFLLLTGISPRGDEYLVPISAFMLATMASLFKHPRRVVIGLIVFQILVSGLPALRNLEMVSGTSYPGIGPNVFAALDKIPVEAIGKKIFNCDWSLGSFILYYRPDLKFVDLIDVGFLHQTSPQVSEFWYALRNGRVSDLREAIRTGFKSDYVLCQDPDFLKRLKADPRFHEMYFAISPSRMAVGLYSF